MLQLWHDLLTYIIGDVHLNVYGFNWWDALWMSRLPECCLIALALIVTLRILPSTRDAGGD